MGYKVKLTVFHRTWEVDYFSVHYYRYIDYRTNKPTSKVNGGYIEIIIRSSERDDIFPWWQFLESADENYLLAEGRLDFYKDSFEGPIAFSYEFQDAFIVEQGERFSGWDNGPMRLHLIISPAIQRYKGVLLVKPWHKSPLPTNEPTPYQPKKDEEPTITEGYFTTLEGEKIPKDQLREGSEVYYVIKTRNAVEKSINLDLADAKNDFKYNGEVLVNELLENVKITSGTQKIKLEVIRQTQNT